jgi:hypothetical protein
MTALTAVSTAATSRAATTGHVFADAPALEPAAGRIAALIDPAFLAEVGWDPVTWLLSPPSEHPLLGRPVCRAAGCGTTATPRDRVCASCRQRLIEANLSVEQLDELPVRSRLSRGPWPCAVNGCRRTWESARTGLCRSHEELQRSSRLEVEQFLEHGETRPLAALALCAVAACPRQRRHPEGRYCEAHQQRLRQARRVVGDGPPPE